MLRGKLVCAGLIAIAFISCVALVLAQWDREASITSHSIAYYPFYVHSYAAGNITDSHFYSWTNTWDHGPAVDGYPPYLFCAYYHRFYHFPLTNPVVVETYASGNVTDKLGEWEDFFSADAVITP